MEIFNQLEKLLTIVHELEANYKGRKFTLDGHLIGSIAEVYCEDYYDLTLLIMSEKVHDAVLPNGEKVQIKVTQANKVGLRHEPEILLVLFLDKKNLRFEEIYNGYGKEPWEKSNTMSTNGQRFITLNKLKEIQVNKQKLVNARD